MDTGESFRPIPITYGKTFKKKLIFVEKAQLGLYQHMASEHMIQQLVQYIALWTELKCFEM